MRRAIVHIGMPRTGSTSFQGLFTRYRRRLRDVGLSYPYLSLPEAEGNNKVNHMGFAEALYGADAPLKAKALDLLASHLSGTRADTVVLSYEDFALQRQRFPVPRLLRDAFDAHGFAMEVAIVVRPIGERLNSLYGLRTQLVHETRSFERFVWASHRSSVFDHEARIAPWREAADGRVTAVPSRDLRSDAPLLTRALSDLDLYDRFTQIMRDGDAETYRSNRSPGPVSVETSRRLCAMRVHRQFQGHSRVIGHAIDDACWSRGLDEEAFQGNAPQAVAAVEAAFAASNDRFAHAAWGRPWNEVVGPAPERLPNELAGGPIPKETEAAITEVSNEVIERFGFRRDAPWRTMPLNLVECRAMRLARVLDRRRWRIP